MSTVTILELPDTQMLDYATDLDVPMHASTEMWLGSMDDDSTMKTMTSSIEVDMEPYDGEFQEFEMGDEQETNKENFNPYVGEPLDVEVYDASQAHTPRVPEIELNSVPLETHNPDAFQVATNSIDPSSDHSHLEPLLLSEKLPEIRLPNPQYDPGAVEHHNSHYQPSQAFLSESEPQPTIGQYDPLEPHPRESDWETLSRVEPSTTVDTTDDGAHTGNTSIHEHPQQERVISPSLADGHAVDQPEHHINNDYTEAPNAEAFGDPHEISEGVYIDPPPAVLLSLPSSQAEQPEFSLFNQPPVMPSLSTSSEEIEPLTLFLQQQPTLYYQPLYQVFEALRQDLDFIARVPDATDAELVMEAYDLQLMLSEDSIHAREVTLHDINVTHDGLGFSGPLRIQIATVMPRFITRYHQLQEQISRINIGSGVEISGPQEDVGEGSGDSHEEADRAEHQDQEPDPYQADRQEQTRSDDNGAISQEKEVSLEDDQHPDEQDEEARENEVVDSEKLPEIVQADSAEDEKTEDEEAEDDRVDHRVTFADGGLDNVSSEAGLDHLQSAVAERGSSADDLGYLSTGIGYAPEHEQYLEDQEYEQDEVDVGESATNLHDDLDQTRPAEDGVDGENDEGGEVEYSGPPEEPNHDGTESGSASTAHPENDEGQRA